METDIKEEPWFASGFPAFSHCGWQKTPIFWSGNRPKIRFQPTFRSAPSGFTTNEAMFGYTQPGFVPNRPSVIGHGVNNLHNKFATARPSNWFETENSQFGNGDSPTTFGTSIRFKPSCGVEAVANNRTVRVQYQAITSMPEYSDKSFEELRLEDYMANRHRTPQVRPTQFVRSDFVQNEMPFFDALLQNRSNAFQGQFFSSGETSRRSNIFDNSTNKFNEPSPLTNPNFLLEYLLNHVKNRLNVQLISDKTRSTCEKLTAKLAEYTEKTLETLMVVVLEDILTTIKGKPQVSVPSTSSTKHGESEPISEPGSAANQKSKTKSSHSAKKVESKMVAGANSSNGCPRSAQPPRNDIASESEDEACSDASSAAEDWCCATKHRDAAKKQRDRSVCAECRCEVRKKSSTSRCAASAAAASGHSRTSGLRKLSQGDCCAKEIPARRMCSSKCAKGKWTPSKGTSRRCQMAKRITHRCYDDEFYIRQRLKNVSVDTDGEDGKVAEASHKEKLVVRCKAAAGDDFCATIANGGTVGADEDEEKDAQPPVTAGSNDGTDESDFSSV